MGRMAAVLHAPTLAGGDALHMCHALAGVMGQLTAEEGIHMGGTHKPGGPTQPPQPVWLLEGAASMLASCRLRAEAGIWGEADLQHMATIESRVSRFYVGRVWLAHGGCLPMPKQQLRACTRPHMFNTRAPLLLLNSKPHLQVLHHLASAHLANGAWASAASAVQALRRSQQPSPELEARLAVISIRAALGMGHVQQASDALLAWLESPACTSAAGACDALQAFMVPAGGWEQVSSSCCRCCATAWPIASPLGCCCCCLGAAACATLWHAWCRDCE